MTGPENGGAKHGGRFQKGRSGNPAGKPKVARHRATLAAEMLLDGEAEALTRKAVELALAGDVIALRLCLERILQPFGTPPAKQGDYAYLQNVGQDQRLACVNLHPCANRTCNLVSLPPLPAETCATHLEAVNDARGPAPGRVAYVSAIDRPLPSPRARVLP
jgi:Family of unknown function (DUF5681)